MRQQPQLILASKSARRRELLAEAGYRFRVAAPPFDEPAAEAGLVGPEQSAEALAYFKAQAVAEHEPGAIVLGADTVVRCGGHLLGKAADAAEARWMLSEMSGSRHAVITGTAIVIAPGGMAPSRRWIASETTHVTMRRLSAEEIDAYVASGEWRDKAGAYAIQETADAFIDRLEGSFTNVVGLPMELLARLWRAVVDHLRLHGCPAP